jgi:hypothetical protein
MWVIAGELPRRRGVAGCSPRFVPRIPAGVTHTFENRNRSRAGALNVFLPGGFEATMPAKVAWFAKQNDSDTREK